MLMHCLEILQLPGHTILLQDDAAIVAVLAIIGGADNRVRLGGMVQNEEHGKGIVTRIAKSGKICVQSCDDERIIKHSPLSLWRVVSNYYYSFFIIIHHKQQHQH